MVNFSRKRAQLYLPTAGCLALLATCAGWVVPRNGEFSVARDFEECAEQAEANAPSSSERTVLMARCSEQFAGRRKAGGGYVFYDFMQDRTFDIAGPNPSQEEHKQIDRAYMAYLDAQRRESITLQLAKRQADEDQASLERARRTEGPPLVLTPKVPLPVKRPPNLPKYPQCGEGSLACSFAKLSDVVRRAFASEPR